MGQNTSQSQTRVTITEPVSAIGSSRADVRCPQDNNVSFQLLSEPLLGFPVTLRVRRANAGTRNDYFRYTASAWKWMSDAGADGIFHLPPVQPERVGQDGELVIVYYTNGGYFSKGSPIRSGRFVMRNPVVSFNVRLLVAASGQHQVECTATLLDAASTMGLSILKDGVRLAYIVPDHRTRQRAERAQTTHRVTLPAPRVSGTYEVSLLGERTGSSALASEALVVPAASATTRYDVFLLAPSSPLHTGTTTTADVATKTCAVPPGTSLRVRCTGPLQDGDVLLVVAPNTPLRLLQAETTYRFLLHPTTGEAVIKIPDTIPSGSDVDGVLTWNVVLCLVHPTGAIVPAAHATAVASKGATALAAPAARPATTPTPTPTAAQPPSSTPAPPVPESTATDNSFLCVICYDAVAVVKLEPCRHVCLCEACLDACMQRTNSGTSRAEWTCPVCRGRVDGHERVFLM